MATITEAPTCHQPAPDDTQLYVDPSFDDAPGHGSAVLPNVATVHTFVGNDAATPVNEEAGCRRGRVVRFIGTVKRFFKKLFRKRKGGDDVEVVPVVSCSALGSAGSDDDKTEPQQLVPAPARSSYGSDFCAGDFFPQPPIPEMLGVTVVAGGHAVFGDPRKMARVVAWLNETAEDNSIDDGVEKGTPADDAKKEDSAVLSEKDCDASVPSPPSALSDEEDEQLETPPMLNEACCLINDVEEVSRGHLLSLTRVRRALGIRQQAPRGGSSNRRVIGRRGGVFSRVLGIAAVSQ